MSLRARLFTEVKTRREINITLNCGEPNFDLLRL
jgi:hypothetical protein